MDIAQNLKLLCSFEKSISQVCRAIGINRQQFSKYLSGASQPSAYNLNQICDHFSIRPADLYLPADELQTAWSIAQAGPAAIAVRCQIRYSGGRSLVIARHSTVISDITSPIATHSVGTVTCSVRSPASMSVMA